MNRYSKFTPPEHSPRSGFALLITIVLLSFLVLILVSLATLTRVETQVAGNNQNLAQARQSALFALNVALGQLQRAAGPDQRVTARADILDSASTVLRDASTGGLRQPLWTGVWLTRNPTVGANNQLDSGSSPTLRTWSTATPSGDNSRVTWLVSGAQTAGTAAVDNRPVNPVSWEADAENSVELARKLGPDGKIAVSAPLVPIEVASTAVAGLGDAGQATLGKYAYWVADEGVKAKANLVTTTLGAAPDTEKGQAHFLAPQANALHKISSLVAGATTDFRTANSAAELARLVDFNQLGLLPSSPASLDVKKFATDVTLHVKGVLADVRNGGMKKDLTAAFEGSSPSAYSTLVNTYGYGAAMLYRNDPELTVPNPTLPAMVGVTDGLPWFGLYAYYNLYKPSTSVPAGVSVNGSPVTPTTSGSLATLPLTLNPRVVSTQLAGQVVKLGGIMPEVVSSRLDIGISSYLQGSTYKLRLHYFPQLVLHNPYSTRISAANFRFQRNFGAFANATSIAARVRINVRVDGLDLAPVVLNQIADPGRFVFRTAANTTNLEPGETRVFSLAGELAATPNTPSEAITFNDLQSQGGLWSKYCDLPGYTGTTNKDAQVEVSISDRRLRAQVAENFSQPSAYKWPFNDGSVRVQGSDGADVSGDTTALWPSGTTIELMVDSVRRLTGYFHRRKGLKNAPLSTKFANGNAVIAPFHGNAPLFSPFENKSGFTWAEIYVDAFGQLVDASIDSEVQPRGPGSPVETHYGDTAVGVPGGPTGSGARRVLRDVPNQPLVSLGQFMHMPTGVFNSIGNYQYRDVGSMFVGGSLANPFLPTTNNLIQNTISGTGNYIMMDDSFLANATLFDRFFFSTVPPAGAAFPEVWKDFNAANPGAGALADTTKPLLNARVRPRAVAAGINPLLSDLRDVEKAAANLMLDGAFNVNSTSVEAWKALLGSLSGNELRLFVAEDRAVKTFTQNELRNPIPRLWSATSEGGVNQPWGGVRALSDDQLTELATRIVQQVKLRGPFLSMGDFLNRRLGAESNLTRAGALQAAIDTTSPDINATIKAAGDPLVNVNGQRGVMDAGRALPVLQSLDGAGQTLNSTVGMPGYLMQQDLVQAFSPAMTARSDTFVVRVYGESRNAVTGERTGRSWAEAVVQRLPEYLNAGADAAHVFPPTNADNVNFGRRFQIVGFRWLTNDEL